MKWLKYWLEGLTVITLSIMTIGVFLQVLFRFVFKVSAAWTVELVTFSFIYTVFLGATLAVKTKGHYTVEIADAVLPKPALRTIKVLADIAVIIFLGVFVYYSWDYASGAMNQITPALRIPEGYVYLIAPVSSVLMIFYLIRSFFIKKRKEDK